METKTAREKIHASYAYGQASTAKNMHTGTYRHKNGCQKRVLKKSLNAHILKSIDNERCLIEESLKSHSHLIIQF